MPPHPSFLEKSLVDRWDFEGLQLDTRARENQDKHLDPSKPQGFLDDDFDDSGNYLNEKQSHAVLVDERSPTSSESSLGAEFSPISPVGDAKSLPPQCHSQKGNDEIVGKPPPVPPERKMCGLKRKHFWELFALTLSFLIAAAVIGGVIGGLRARNNASRSPPAASSSSPSPSNNTNSSSVTIPSAQPQDLMVGSPLPMVTYDEGPGQSLVARQAFRMVFQTVNGNIKEAVSNHQESWQSAVPIFTDAINNTGLATVTYLNQTAQQGSIFYVGANGLLQEKRKWYNSSDSWQPGSLNALNLPATGNISSSSQDSDPQNNWDGFRMAAVYSVNFDDGPGIRLFYHTVQLNGSTYVQELIWNQKTDIWSKGAIIQRPYPNSHLAVTVDENSKVLRLFFSSGNKTLSEEWLKIADTKEGYRSGEEPSFGGPEYWTNESVAGLDFEGLLHSNAADLATTSLYGTTYVYYYSAADQKAGAGIRELFITGVRDAVNNQETYNLSSPLVAAPMLSVNGATSLYQPLAVSNSAVTGGIQQLYVFWADKVTGDQTTAISGFGGLSQNTRPITNTTWPSIGIQQIPLGSKNAEPP